MAGDMPFNTLIESLSPNDMDIGKPHSPPIVQPRSLADTFASISHAVMEAIAPSTPGSIDLASFGAEGSQKDPSADTLHTPQRQTASQVSMATDTPSSQGTSTPTPRPRRCARATHLYQSQEEQEKEAEKKKARTRRGKEKTTPKVRRNNGAVELPFGWIGDKDKKDPRRERNKYRVSRSP